MPESTSRTQTAFTGSSPDAERRNTTCAPSLETVMLRGAPSVNRLVAAWRRGNDCGAGSGKISVP